MVIRRTRFLRRLWRAITVSVNASDKRNTSLARTAFSNRDSVGCDANDPPVIGSRPARSFITGSKASRAASLPSA